jgi:hypothetical protein
MDQDIENLVQAIERLHALELTPIPPAVPGGCFPMRPAAIGTTIAQLCTVLAERLSNPPQAFPGLI